MSLGEMLVVIFISLLIMKPEDILSIIKKFQQSKTYFTNVKNEIISYVTKELEIDEDILENDIEELNFYLQEIISIQGYYGGDYSIEKLKTKYHELMKARIRKFN